MFHMSREYNRDFSFNRMEVAGAMGDLGTLLPLAIGMILINGLSATNVFWLIGLFYILTGLYFRVPVPVQPMKVIGAYAISYGLTPQQITASNLWMGVLLLFLGFTGLIKVIGTHMPKSTVRGVQLSMGIVLMLKGFKLMAQKDPNLALNAIGSLPIGLTLGAAGIILTFLFINNQRVPAALAILGMGMFFGIFLGHPLDFSQIEIRLHIPRLMPYTLPSWADFLWAFPVLVLPQIPMTVGNAIISNTDMTKEYFGTKASRSTYRSITLSQGLAGIFSYVMGGIPMCHGAGGLAAHYRFGARTGGSNLIIGGIFLLMAVLLGENMVIALKLLPFSILGVLILFAGLELATMIKDLKDKKDFFVALLMVGLALTFNLGVAFLAGIFTAFLFESERISI
jgi:SulP family sulfate permease